MRASPISSPTFPPRAARSWNGSKGASCPAWRRWPVSERWPEAVVFDLDGTLIDSVGDITDALNGALLKTGLEPFSEAEVRLMVGGGARVLVDRVLSARNLSGNAALAQ